MITRLKMNLHLKIVRKMCARWPDEMEDLRFDMARLPGSGKPTAPLSRRCFPTAPFGGPLLVRCGLLYRRGHGEADRLITPGAQLVSRRLAVARPLSSPARRAHPRAATSHALQP